jgi:formate dehydrogenase subunit delta
VILDIEHLVKMVNEISVFFESESPGEQAPRDVANHLRRFWEPRMRKQIIEHYNRGAAGLEDIGRAAVGLLAADSAAAPDAKPAS